ncbi:MAG: TonB-dependent receptor [Chitinophagaceae bacterium]|nr:TonB-dependent receptor [Chitinophagaceae bacterium]
MRVRFSPVALAFAAIIFSVAAIAQTPVTITGSVKNKKSLETVPAVSVSVKGTSEGTYTDERGNFRLTTTHKLPVTLIISSVGFGTQEVTVNSVSQAVNIDFDPVYIMGQDIVVAASRTPERILESPVTIERVSPAMIRNAPGASYYDIIANLKGVDMTTSSLMFKTPSTRGFNGSGNLRFNQLLDGMDNQAPGLNFSVGNVIGLTELDVDNMELLSGASSALYGSGGMNGTLLINSKDPFKYQGFSFLAKQGVMHVDNYERKASPYFDYSFRWAKKIGENFAFKITSQFIKADDWQANDKTNLARNNVLSGIKGGDRTSDPNYDGVNVFGDEVSASMSSFAQAVLFGPGNPSLPSVAAQLGAALGRAPTQAEIVGFYATTTNAQLAPFKPFAVGLAQNYYGAQSVSRTGYDERDMVNYNAYNIKVAGGLYYKFKGGVEASLSGHWATGTTVYTGADRYSLKNLKMGQYKLEFKGNNWFLRGYTTQENSGESYAATIAAIYINRAWKDDQSWLATYTGTYSGARQQGAPDATAHAAARQAADAGRFLPGSPQFEAALNDAISKPIGKGGAKFADRTNLYHYEGQYNLTSVLKFAEVIVGASLRTYSLNSQGTIFVDTTGKINITEFGSYLQVQKKLFKDVLKLTGSIRYDKNENFKGRFTPRISAVIKVAKDNNIRLSYQTAYRFPSAQDQYINLQTPGSRLIGGLPQFKTYFNFAGSPAYTAESIVAYRTALATGTPSATAVGSLKVGEFNTVKPESVKSFEIGYKGLIAKKLLLDVYWYSSKYEDFIARVAVGRGQSASTNPAVNYQELASPFTTSNYSFVSNSPTPVKANGWGIGLQYEVYKGYNVMANVYSDQLKDVPAGLVTFFNTPKTRFNVGLGNDNVFHNIGFNVIYKWQDKVYWEGTFGSGEIPAFGVMDAQLSYKLTKIKSLIKIGSNNFWNKYYRSAFGNPQVGGLYYISFGYNVF